MARGGMLEIEEWFLHNTVGNITAASILSALISIMALTPDYQAVKPTNDPILNIFILLLNATLIACLVIGIIALISIALEWLRDKILDLADYLGRFF